MLQLLQVCITVLQGRIVQQVISSDIDSCANSSPKISVANMGLLKFADTATTEQAWNQALKILPMNSAKKPGYWQLFCMPRLIGQLQKLEPRRHDSALGHFA
jgi:hypothetical protein